MRRPNILLLLPDQHRGDYMPNPVEYLQACGLPEIELQVPHLRSLMENGTTFLDCVTPSPICAPARACLALGTRYESCSVKDNTVDIPTGKKTLYTALRDVGYEVMGTGKFDVHKATKYWGADGWVEGLCELGFTRAIDNEGKFDAIIGSVSPSATNPAGDIEKLIDLENEYDRGPYMKYLYEKGVAQYHVSDFSRRMKDIHDIEFTDLADEDYCDNWITNNTMRLFGEKNGDAPWFMQVNFTGPHDPWDIRKEMYESVKDRCFPPAVDTDVPSDIVSEIRKRYVAMIENIDRNIGRILAYLESRGELENTIIIYASDHGEMLGDHGLFGKAVPYRQSVQVPLIISGPGLLAGQICHGLVELQDLTSTIIDLAGGDSRFPESISLKDTLVSGRDCCRSYQRSALGTWRMYKDERYKFICSESGFSLFDLDNDIDEMTDISHVFPQLCRQYMEVLEGIPCKKTKRSSL